MKETLERLLHVPIQEVNFDVYGKLPLLLEGLYNIRAFKISGTVVYMINPKEHISLPKLKKHLAKLTDILQGECILYSEGYSRYGISKLVEMGVSFIFGDNNIYLPNLGIRIHEKNKAKLPNVKEFSPFTQKMILIAIYDGWECISGREISEILGVSRMTVNRAFLELEALGIPTIIFQGKSKYFKSSFSRKDLFGLCEEFFINPVKKTIKINSSSQKADIKSGVSALAVYTGINDDSYSTFAVTQEEYRNLKINSTEIADKYEYPCCVIQIHRYMIVRDHVIDPISAILSVPESERDDERIELAIEEIKKGVFDGRWAR